MLTGSLGGGPWAAASVGAATISSSRAARVAPVPAGTGAPGAVSRSKAAADRSVGSRQAAAEAARIAWLSVASR